MAISDQLAGAVDFKALTSLRAQARQNSPEAAKAVARQFEALLLQNMLKSMRDASLGSGLLDNSQSQMYQGLYDQQIATDIAERGGLGLAETLLQQIAPKGSSAAEVGDGALDAFEPRWWQGMHGEPLETVRNLELAERIEKALGDDSPDSAQETAEAGDLATNRAARSLSSREEFVRALAPHAEAAGKRLGVDPNLLLAQAALETGWGKHMIRANGDNSYNLFGIKAGSSWTGEKMKVSTTEYVDGVARKEKAPFRAYDSYAHSFNDYVDFLQSRSRYAPALRNAEDPAAYIRSLQKAGYATDPKYADKVLNIMNNQIRELRMSQAAGGSDNG
jgi:peptidoglycan hydrolase FlgJ